MAERGLQEPPDHQKEHPDSDGPDQHFAERLLGQLPHSALVGRFTLVVTHGQLQRQPRNQQVYDAVRNQSRADRKIQPLTVRRTLAH